MAQGSRKLRIGVVGLKGRWSSQQLVDAFERRDAFRCLIELDRVTLDLGRDRVSYEDVDLASLDGIVIKKLGNRYTPELLDRLEMLRFLHERGTPVFSQPGSIVRLIDRLSCTVGLRLAGVPIPETVVTEDIEQAVAAVEHFGRAVLKPLFTSKARGMQVVEAGDDARGKITTFREAGNHVLYVQRMLELPGQDLGIVFLGGEYLASYARVAQVGAWHTSSSRGGKYRACEPSDEIIELARRAQAPFNLDFTCVDVAETSEGPRVFEVSAFGGFRGLQEAAGMNAAERYADYVIGKLTNA